MDIGPAKFKDWYKKIAVILCEKVNLNVKSFGS